MALDPMSLAMLLGGGYMLGKGALDAFLGVEELKGRKAERGLQYEMLKSQQIGTERATKESRASADRLVTQLMNLRREERSASREDTMAQMIMQGADRRMMMLMSMLQGLSPQGSQREVPFMPPITMSSLLRGTT